MNPKKTAIAAIVAATLLGQSQAYADLACEAAPSPECLLDLAHIAAEQINSPVERATALMTIAAAEAAAGYREQSESSLALAQLITDAPGLADGFEQSDYGPQSEDDIRSHLNRELIATRARSGASLEDLTAIIDAAPDFEYELMLSFVAAQALVETDRDDDARKLVERVMRLVRDDENAERATALRAAIAMLYVEIGDLDTALSLAREMPDGDEMLSKTGLYVRIAEMQREAGDEAGARETLKLAEQVIPAIENAEMRDVATTMVSDMVSRLDSGETEADAGTHSGNCPADLSPYGLAVDKARFGYYAEAVEMALALNDPEKRDNALSSIASFQTDDGKLDDAYNTATMIRENFSRSFAIGRIVEAYANRGDADGALAAVQAIPEEFERNRMLQESVRLLASADNTSGAAWIASFMPDPRQQVAAYATLAETMLKAEKELLEGGVKAGEETGDTNEPG